MKLLPAVLALAAILQTATAGAHFSSPESVPVARLLKLTTEAVKKHPDSAAAHYTLARVHYLAFATGETKLDAYLSDKGDNSPPSVGPFNKFTYLRETGTYEEAKKRTLAEMKLKEPPKYDSPEEKKYSDRLEAISEELSASGQNASLLLPEAQAAEHITRAVEEFQAARKLDPKDALTRLGYASLLEQASLWAKTHPDAKLPPEIRALTPAGIRAEFRDTWQMEVRDDLKHKDDRGMLSAMDMVSYEAGTAYARLAESAKGNLPPDETRTLGTIRKSLEDLKKDTGRAITPIVFGVSGNRALADLLAPETVVNFPLRGYGPDGRWPWVKPDTALLVWNPSGSGKVASGAQLFGGYTWELFWKTGYEPLAVLDADGDGSLTGAELAGLAAWFDRNGNGVADPGEVQPLAELGITALAARAVSCAEGEAPMNPRGVTFADGRVLPTWDWMVEEK